LARRNRKEKREKGGIVNGSKVPASRKDELKSGQTFPCRGKGAGKELQAGPAALNPQSSPCSSSEKGKKSQKGGGKEGLRPEHLQGGTREKNALVRPSAGAGQGKECEIKEISALSAREISSKKTPEVTIGTGISNQKQFAKIRGKVQIRDKDKLEKPKALDLTSENERKTCAGT